MLICYSIAKWRKIFNLNRFLIFSDVVSKQSHYSSPFIVSREIHSKDLPLCAYFAIFSFFTVMITATIGCKMSRYFHLFSSFNNDKWRSIYSSTFHTIAVYEWEAHSRDRARRFRQYLCRDFPFCYPRLSFHFSDFKVRCHFNRIQCAWSSFECSKAFTHHFDVLLLSFLHIFSNFLVCLQFTPNFFRFIILCFYFHSVWQAQHLETTCWVSLVISLTFYWTFYVTPSKAHLWPRTPWKRRNDTTAHLIHFDREINKP